MLICHSCFVHNAHSVRGPSEETKKSVHLRHEASSKSGGVNLTDRKLSLLKQIPTDTNRRHHRTGRYIIQYRSKARQSPQSETFPRH